MLPDHMLFDKSIERSVTYEINYRKYTFKHVQIVNGRIVGYYSHDKKWAYLKKNEVYLDGRDAHSATIVRGDLYNLVRDSKKKKKVEMMIKEIKSSHKKFA